jgi:hypothetical protein
LRREQDSPLFVELRFRQSLRHTGQNIFELFSGSCRMLHLNSEVFGVRWCISHMPSEPNRDVTCHLPIDADRKYIYTSVSDFFCRFSLSEDYRKKDIFFAIQKKLKNLPLS